MIFSRIRRRAAVLEILGAIHLVTMADLLGLERIKRAGFGWAASAARRFEAAAQDLAKDISA